MKGPTPRHARLGGRAALVGFGDATFDAAYIATTGCCRLGSSRLDWREAGARFAGASMMEFDTT